MKDDRFSVMSPGDIDAFDYITLAGDLNAVVDDSDSVSCGSLMDVAEGLQEMSPGLARKLADFCSASALWLLTGSGRPFPMLTLGTYSGISWEDFFDTDCGGSHGYLFELTRIDGGRHDGTLIIHRLHERLQTITTGVVTEAFYLRAGMGSGGYGNLKTFLQFLKRHEHQLALSSWQFTPPEPDFDFWSVMGQHHPAWFRDQSRRAPSRWLQQVLNGEDPGEWFAGGWTSLLYEVKATSTEPSEDENPEAARD